jgi:hypothetical protein
MKHSNLYLGLVLPSGGWQSLICGITFTIADDDISQGQGIILYYIFSTGHSLVSFLLGILLSQPNMK